MYKICSLIRELALAVLKASEVQLGKMLIDVGGNSYEEFPNSTIAFLNTVSWFTRKATHPSSFPMNT